jgi:hypothetical protein
MMSTEITFDEALDAAILKLGVDRVVELCASNFEILEIDDELHEIQLWDRIYKRDACTFRRNGRHFFIADIEQARKYLTSI